MFKKILDICVYLILIIIGWLTSFLSIRLRTDCGKFIGRILLVLFWKRYKIAKSNIEIALPDKNNSEVKKIAIGSFQNLGITLLEILYLQNVNKEDLSEIVKIKNPEFVKQKISEGKGVILLSAHYGNWELMALATGVILETSLLIVVEQQTNNYITEKMYGIRTKFGNRTVGRYSAAKSLISALQNGEVIAFLGDQSANPNNDIFIDFFGIPAVTYEAPAMLALKFNSALLFTLAQRQQDGSYLLEFIEINHDGLSYSKEDIRKLTEKHVRVLEQGIRENPADWAWMHKRWKHKKPNSNYE